MSFSFPCLRQLRKQLGEFDAVCEVLELSARSLLAQAGARRIDDYVQELSEKHGVRVDAVNLRVFDRHRAHLFLTSVHSCMEEFCFRLRDEHPSGRSWNWEGNDDRLTKLVKAIGFEKNSDFELCDYYRRVRNAVAHRLAPSPSQTPSITQQQRAAKKLENLDAPNLFGESSFDDFILYARSAKALAANICTHARPTNSQLKIIVKGEAKKTGNAGRLSKNPQRLRKWEIGYLRTTYSLSDEEAVNIVVGH